MDVERAQERERIASELKAITGAVVVAAALLPRSVRPALSRVATRLKLLRQRILAGEA